MGDQRSSRARSTRCAWRHGKLGRPPSDDVARVALFLTWQGIEGEDGQATAERLGQGDGARLRHQQVRREHVVGDVVDEAERTHGVLRGEPRKSLDAPEQASVSPADDQDVGVGGRFDECP